MQNLLFNFADTSATSPAAKKVASLFHRVGANVVEQDIDSSVKRSSGISYREMTLTFADSQKVVLRIKQTGDIFQILVNGKVQPIKNQDDHAKAIAEIAQLLDAGRVRFQKALAAVRVRPPSGIRTAAPKMEQVLTEKRDALKAAVAEVRAQIDKVKPVPTSA